MDAGGGPARILARAGFADVTVHGAYTDAAPTADDTTLVVLKRH